MKYQEIQHEKIQEFESIHEFITFLNESPVHHHFDPKALSSETGSEYFTKTSSYKEAIDLLQSGYLPAATKMASSIKLKNSTQQDYKSSRQSFSVVGGQASVPRYLQGIPTNMIDRKTTPAKQKVITLTKEISYSANVSSQTMEDEGIKALQIVQAIENQGMRVKLNILLCSDTRQNEKITIKVCIKKPDERISLSKIAFPIAHPSMLRRLFFRAIEVHPTLVANISTGYGIPSTPHLDKNEYFMPKVIPNVQEYVDSLKL